ncbi:Ig-like domain-containing protein [Spongisporangium articulatum]|uniref:Ig-like domain-containing protein n=1 Tax=Spongisporangium articulatum TaxID=3362603 RepID=A0ABW8ATV6_9ACTN
MITAAALSAVFLAGCNDSGPTGGGGAAASPSPTNPTVSLSKEKVSYLDPVKLVVANGTFQSVQVLTADGEQQLEGSVSADKTSWVSEEAPRPASAYSVVTQVTGATGGAAQTKTLDFTVQKVPDAKKVSFTVTPDDGTTVGIGQPIDVRFLVPITNKAGIERAMSVTTKTPSGEAVQGSWSWLNDQEVHWRPKEFWTPGTKVTLDMKIAGVKAGNGRYGRKDYSETFTIGASHVTRYDAKKLQVKVYRDGKLKDTWPSGSGRPGLETYSGTYVVLNKSKVINMDSCSARITCDKKDPDYYSEKEYWATRITASGTFLHAADWDPQLGKANVSHGCIHLSGTDAEDFYNHAVPGDVVIVTNTGRGPQERIATQDPGLYDWNLSWSKWTKGSALK